MAEIKANFDPYAGRRLYSYLYKLDFTDIRVRSGRPPFLDPLRAPDLVDAYNWSKKLEGRGQEDRLPTSTATAPGYEGLSNRSSTPFSRVPGRFTYTPVISACGRKADILSKATSTTSRCL